VCVSINDSRLIKEKFFHVTCIGVFEGMSVVIIVDGVVQHQSSFLGGALLKKNLQIWFKNIIISKI
jgi:hypothetical protein